MAIRVSISGLTPRPFARFNWTVAAGRWADEVAPIGRDAIRAKAPVAPGPGSGRLKASIVAAHAKELGRVAVSFESSAPYAKYVVGGTQPHIIRARRARALRWQSQGSTLFAASVNHPGTKPNPFPRRALEPLLPVIQKRFAEIVKSSLRS